MRVIPPPLSGALLIVALAGAAVAAPPPSTPAEVATFKEKGAYVFREAGASLPLYTFDRDRAGASSCNGSCAADWPPLAALPGSAPIGEWSAIRRDDGALQWAWRGKPVYTSAKDSPEKATGDGGAWRLIPPIPVG